MATTLAKAAILAVTLGACSTLPVPPTTGDCAGPARDYGGPVVGSFSTSIGAIRALQGSGQPANWADKPADYPAILCYLDAQIAKAPPPGPNGQIHEPYDRIVVAIVDGVPTLVEAGYRDRLPVKAP